MCRNLFSGEYSPGSRSGCLCAIQPDRIGRPAHRARLQNLFCRLSRRRDGSSFEAAPVTHPVREYSLRMFRFACRTNCEAARYVFPNCLTPARIRSHFFSLPGRHRHTRHVHHPGAVCRPLFRPGCQRFCHPTSKKSVDIIRKNTVYIHLKVISVKSGNNLNYSVVFLSHSLY